MSLLDALRLDPFRINVWIAYRTDGVKGTGTQNDPWDGSTAAKLDALLNSFSANTHAHDLAGVDADRDMDVAGPPHLHALQAEHRTRRVGRRS